jgi:hypothetical protein
VRIAIDVAPSEMTTAPSPIRPRGEEPEPAAPPSPVAGAPVGMMVVDEPGVDPAPVPECFVPVAVVPPDFFVATVVTGALVVVVVVVALPADVVVVVEALPAVVVVVGASAAQVGTVMTLSFRVTAPV